MGAERKTNGAGLLIMKTSGKFRVTTAILLLMLSRAVYAEDVPQFVIETYPETPETGKPWTFTLLVEHGEPDEVTVIAPPFTGALSFDRLVKNPRTSDAKVQTAIEYRFIPNRPGLFMLESFTVITPEGRRGTVPLVLDIRRSGAESRPITPRVNWEGAPRQMAAGERAALVLRVSGWENVRPPQEFFMPEVPPGAILASEPLTAQERESGLAIKLTLIPLEGDFRLPPRVLYHENAVFEIPALNIRVSGFAAGGSFSKERPAEQGAQRNTADFSDDTEARFPDFELAALDRSILGRSVFKRAWRGQCENIYNTARDLWDSGCRAQSLAELRRSERDHPAGVLLRPIRREAEENLMLFNTENESRLRRGLLLGLSFFLLLLVIISPVVCSILIRSSPWKKAALLCAVVLTILGSFYIYLFLDSRSVFKGVDGRFGIANETPVRRTADFDGEELFSFREGQPVAVLLKGDLWLFVRAKDATGGTGWIPAETVIFY